MLRNCPRSWYAKIALHALGFSSIKEFGLKPAGVRSRSIHLEEDRFTRLRTERKHFIDTIKVIAYRAESSLASPLREHLARTDDARTLLRQIFDNLPRARIGAAGRSASILAASHAVTWFW